MIPLWLTIRITAKSGHSFRFWVPLLLIWLVLILLLVLLSPVIAILCLIQRLNPFPILIAMFSLLAAAAGTSVDIAAALASVQIRIQ